MENTNCDPTNDIPNDIVECPSSNFCFTPSAGVYEGGTCSIPTSVITTNPLPPCADGDTISQECLCNTMPNPSNPCVSSNSFILDVFFIYIRRGTNITSVLGEPQSSRAYLEYNNGRDCINGNFLIEPTVMANVDPQTSPAPTRALFQNPSGVENDVVCNQGQGRVGVVEVVYNFTDPLTNSGTTTIRFIARRNTFGLCSNGDCSLLEPTPSTIQNASFEITGDTDVISLSVTPEFVAPRTVIFTIEGGIRICRDDRGCAGTGLSCQSITNGLGVCAAGCGGVENCSSENNFLNCNTCPSNQFCSGVRGTCSASCNQDQQCSAQNENSPFCVNGACVECKTSTDCSLGNVCISGMCQPPNSGGNSGNCSQDSDCGTGNVCQNNRCVPSSSINDFTRELILYGALALGIIVVIGIVIIILTY